MNDEEFIDKYCKACGSQRCGGISDELMSEGCPHYREHRGLPSLPKVEPKINNEIKNRLDTIFGVLPSHNTKRLKKLDELATGIEKVSGYSLEKLLKLFMAGYTLKPPMSGYTAMYAIIDELDDYANSNS